MQELQNRSGLRPKHLPFSTEVLERLKKQSDSGVPEISETFQSGATQFSTNRYYDESAFQNEKELFLKRPIFGGFADQIARPGDFIAHKFMDKEWILLRDESMRLKAFPNSCLHRGTKLLSENRPGPIRKIVCPYHSWTYDLNGILLNSGCKTDSSGLRPLDIAEKAGLLFVGLTQDALSPLFSFSEEWTSHDFDSYVPFSIRTDTGRYNWKVGVEIFLETYHISTVHKNSVAPVVEKNASIFDAFGENSRTLIPNRSYKSASEVSRKDLVITYFLFPSTILVLFRDHFGVIHFEPIDVNHTRCTRAVMIPEKPKSERMSKFWEANGEFFLRTTEEDLDLAPTIHSGISQNEFINPTSWEPGIFHFHHSLSQALRIL